MSRKNRYFGKSKTNKTKTKCSNEIFKFRIFHCLLTMGLIISLQVEACPNPLASLLFANANRAAAAASAPSSNSTASNSTNSPAANSSPSSSWLLTTQSSNKNWILNKSKSHYHVFFMIQVSNVSSSAYQQFFHAATNQNILSYIFLRL